MFILTHEVTIKIRNTKGIGKLIDQIIKVGEGIAAVQDFVWKAELVSFFLIRNSIPNEKP